ncbi:MAG: polymer-forming cytoskeletal protein [Deltaproteobacteria bacterium]|nr:polymer-forming cytoskeletal protein [Deltaproteobacteria bacterium]
MAEPITIIGENTTVSGNLEGDEDLTVEGRVEGSINLTKTLSIEVGGVVRANINVRNVVISGVLVGNIEAQEAVHITEQGRVVGDITAPRVILVDGSSFRGNIDMGDFDIDREIPPAAIKREPVPRPAAVEERAEKVERPAHRKPAAKPSRAPKRTPAKAVAKKRKKPPAPKVRSVGKAKARRKKR